ncbi:hypothetical protein LY78DRAFT_693083 [Colletotrichum sublineola]|nr:hypothetical protein LY78DRAFT_693083 [Colletotrichum sublineola]
MADQANHGSWYNIVEKLFNRGFLDNILSAPGAVVSQILSPPATTTQNNVQPAAKTQVAATTKAAAPAPTTQAAAAPVAATQAPATQQPAASPAASPASSPEQEQPQQQQNPSPAAQAPSPTQQAAQQPEVSKDAARLTAAATGSSHADVLTTSPPVAAETVPPTAENAASSQLSLPQSSSISQTGAGSIGGAAVATEPGVTSPTTQSPQTPLPKGTSNANNQGPLVATGAVLGIVVLLGLSLLIFWCLRRRKRAARHSHAAVPEASPIDGYAPDDRFRDNTSQGHPGMSETNSIVSGDMVIHHHHPHPGEFRIAQTTAPGQGNDAPGTIPFASQPFSYAQAQQYVQSLADTGTFVFPPPPPVPQPSPIRIFRWPTRSSRSGMSTPSVFTGFRSNNSRSRHQSQVSRSTMSSMLWHGRRDIIARSTSNQTPALPKPNFGSNNNSPESTMPEGAHTPVLDWLQWIRGHQQVEPDPEMNHRKSFASTESSVSEASHTRSASTASSGVFSPTVPSWQPPMTTPCAIPENRQHTDPFQYIPLPLFKGANSSSESNVGSSGSITPGGAIGPHPH